jgi:hypothetical protein
MLAHRLRHSDSTQSCRARPAPSLSTPHTRIAQSASCIRTRIVKRQEIGVIGIGLYLAYLSGLGRRAPDCVARGERRAEHSEARHTLVILASDGLSSRVLSSATDMFNGARQQSSSTHLASVSNRIAPALHHQTHRPRLARGERPSWRWGPAIPQLWMTRLDGILAAAGCHGKQTRGPSDGGLICSGDAGPLCVNPRGCLKLVRGVPRSFFGIVFCTGKSDCVAVSFHRSGARHHRVLGRLFLWATDTTYIYIYLVEQHGNYERTERGGERN